MRINEQVSTIPVSHNSLLYLKDTQSRIFANVAEGVLEIELKICLIVNSAEFTRLF